MNETTETTQESREIAWCCSACEDAGYLLAGHFECNRPEIPEGWAILTDCGHTAEGPRVVIAPITIRCGGKSEDGGARRVVVTIDHAGRTVAGIVAIVPRTDRPWQPGELMLGAAIDGPDWLPEDLRQYNHIRARIEAAAIAVC